MSGLGMACALAEALDETIALVKTFLQPHERSWAWSTHLSHVWIPEDIEIINVYCFKLLSIGGCCYEAAAH